jgi:hypothetical protein
MLAQGTRLELLGILLIFASVHVGNGQVNHPPLFTKSFYFVQFAENKNIGDFVFRVNATDVDVNDTLSYKLVTGSTDFAIDGNGKITAKKSFDRETTSSYLVTAEVSDGVSRPFTEQATVYVNIADENDNKPDFKNTPYSVTLSENTNIDQTVLTVVATDPDLGRNSRIQYRITDGDPNSHFSLSLYGGVITLMKSLDYESKQTYRLTVQAKDMGSPSMSSQEHINIDVTDFDDQGPAFSQSSYRTDIKEDLAVVSSTSYYTSFDHLQFMYLNRYQLY